MNLLIADDHNLTAKLLEKFIKASTDYNIVDVVYNGMDVLKNVEAHAVDLVLLDITMPLLDGIRTLQLLKKEHKDIKVIILSIHHEPWIIKKALDFGAVGFLSKQSEKEEVLEAIKQVSQGKIYLSKIIRHYFDDSLN